MTDLEELRWWREMFLCRLSAESIPVNPGEPLFGRSFLLTEVLPSEVDAMRGDPPAAGWSGGLRPGAYC